MKTYFCDREFAYDGTQLRSLYAYLNYKVLGDSIVSWIGPCDISFEHMLDGEDLVSLSTIKGDKMLHFIVEKFDVSLFSGVALQRILASLAIDLLRRKSTVPSLAQQLRRSGDDIFFAERKLSISVAAQSVQSTLVHFAMNITNEGTPVETLSLTELEVQPKEFGINLMTLFACEVESMVQASRKVRPLPI